MAQITFSTPTNPMTREKQLLYPALTLIILALIGVGLILFGCGTPQMRGVCRHSAMYAAIVYGESYDTRIAVGPIAVGAEETHAQAQASIEDHWKWLQTDGRGVWVGWQDPFVPTHYFSPHGFYEQYLR